LKKEIKNKLTIEQEKRKKLKKRERCKHNIKEVERMNRQNLKGRMRERGNIHMRER